MTIAPTVSTPLRRAKVAVLDFETTWTDPDHTQHPVSVCVVHCDLGVAGSERVAYRSLINPVIPIRAEATAIHAITDGMVKSAPLMADVIGPLLDALEDRVLGSYNLPFDWKILSEQAHVTGHICPQFGSLDPLVWARVVDKRKNGKKLTDVCKRRKIEFKAHDATEDAIATAKVMPLLLAELKSIRGFPLGCLEDVAILWKWQCRTAKEWESEFAQYQHKHGKDGPNMPWTKLLGADDSAGT